MSNHFHAVVETPRANLADGMKWFLGEYTKRFNGRHKLFGHLFSGRYKALIVDGNGNGEWEEEFKGLERGWCFGSETFREEMLLCRTTKGQMALR